MDEVDFKILDHLQKDASRSAAQIADAVGLTEEDCTARIELLEKDGVIENRVALLDPKKVGAGVTVFVAVVAPEHSKQWLETFHAAVKAFPEVMEFYRMSGQVDYLLRVVATDLKTFSDFLMHRLLRLPMVAHVRSSILLDEVKSTTALPLDRL